MQTIGENTVYINILKNINLQLLKTICRPQVT